MVWVSWLSLTVDTTEMETLPFLLDSCPLTSSHVDGLWSWSLSSAGECRAVQSPCRSSLLPALKSQFLLEESQWFEVISLLFSFLTKILQLVRKFVAMLLPSEDSYSLCVFCDLSGRSPV